MNAVILDFDGTIADSLPVATDLFYEWAKIEPFPPSDVDRLRNSTLKDVIHELGIPLWRLPSLMVHARNKFGKRLGDVPVFAGMPEVIKQLHTSGYSLYVMSSNGPQNIHKFLKRHKISQYFSGIHGNTGLFGKATAIRLVLHKYKIDPSNCVCIGDETRDVDAAKRAHIKCIAVTWGYNGQKILKAHQPDYIAATPKQLLNIVQSLG